MAKIHKLTQGMGIGFFVFSGMRRSLKLLTVPAAISNRGKVQGLLNNSITAMLPSIIAQVAI